MRRMGALHALPDRHDHVRHVRSGLEGVRALRHYGGEHRGEGYLSRGVLLQSRSS